MLHHILKSFFPRLFAKVHINGYLSAEEGLQPAGKIAQHTTGANSDSADNTEVADNAITFKR